VSIYCAATATAAAHSVYLFIIKIVHTRNVLEMQFCTKIQAVASQIFHLRK